MWQRAVEMLVRYRDNHGLAVLDLSTFDRPTINQSSEFAAAGSVQPIVDVGLLLTSADASPAVGFAAAPGRRAANYDVMDTSRAGTPVPLASIPGVTQQLKNVDTATVFLLADNGVTVVRNLHSEEAHSLHIALERQ